MAGRFGAVVTAMVTPFEDDASLDLDRAREVAAWLLDHGTDSLVVTGSTGEAATLSDDEKIAMWAATAEVARDRGGQVIAGTGTYDTAHTVHLTREAEKAGADAMLVVTPYYNKPPQTGLIAHFTAAAEATTKPVMVYNIPGRTGTRISHETLLEIARVENIVAVKDSTGDLDGMAHLAAEIPEGFEIYCGDDWAIFPMVLAGARGVVSVAAHVAGERIHQMIDLLEGGDAAGARKINESLLPIFDGMFLQSNPIPLKAAMEMLGQPVGPPRLPLVPATDDERAAVRKALEDGGAL